MNQPCSKRARARDVGVALRDVNAGTAGCGTDAGQTGPNPEGLPQNNVLNIVFQYY